MDRLDSEFPVPAEVYLTMSFIIGENMFRCTHREMRGRLYRLMGNVELNDSFDRVLRTIMHLKNTEPERLTPSTLLGTADFGLSVNSRDYRRLPSDWASRSAAPAFSGLSDEEA